MQHQNVALDFPTKFEVPTGAVANATAAQTLGMAGRAIYQLINECSGSDQLDEFGRLLWRGYGEGKIAEAEATYLAPIIERRRPLGCRTAPGHTTPLAKVAGRIGSRFAPRQRPRSPDRKASRDRRRMLGGSSALPDDLRHHYTEGQRSVLCIVSGEIKRHGICELSYRQDRRTRGRLPDYGTDGHARGAPSLPHHD